MNQVKGKKEEQLLTWVVCSDDRTEVGKPTDGAASSPTHCVLGQGKQSCFQCLEGSVSTWPSIALCLQPPAALH